MSKKTLSARIEEFERKRDGLNRNASKCCMYKVHEQLRDINDKAYKPTLLAIGPYNDHDNVGQGFMEDHKLHYLQQMLKRTGESVETYIKALKDLEEGARKCYVECISETYLTSDQFVDMMLLDGCFIIELFRKYERKVLEDDPIFQMTWVLPRIARDLLLFENQLPFFVLKELFKASESMGSRNLGEHTVNIEKKDGNSVERSDFIDDIILTRLNDLALGFFYDFLPFQWKFDKSSYKAEFEHLLGLMHATISISILDAITPNARERQDQAEVIPFKRLLRQLETEARVEFKKAKKIKRLPTFGENEDWNIRSATELEEAGIKFKTAKNCNGFSIKFNNALALCPKMEISPLSIEDDTETYLRNLIAYEQYSYIRDKGFDYVTSYMCFMDDLINTPKDVALLRRRGIIQNSLGDDEFASNMINKLGHYIAISTNSSIYARTSMDINNHCRRRCNIWMAKLRRDYFNSPWALLSFLAAVLLLALAIAQTVFSIINP